MKTNKSRSIKRPKKDDSYDKARSSYIEKKSLSASAYTNPGASTASRKASHKEAIQAGWTGRMGLGKVGPSPKPKKLSKKKTGRNKK